MNGMKRPGEAWLLCIVCLGQQQWLALERGPSGGRGCSQDQGLGRFKQCHQGQKDTDLNPSSSVNAQRA